jgi:L-seryl-tRNA(Ser) seleniumtransferase
MANSREESAAAAAYRRLPAVDDLLRRSGIVELEARFSRALVVAAARGVLDDLRARIAREPALAEEEFDTARLEARLIARLEAELAYSLRAVINATGVVLHTNLGRAPLSARAMEHLRDVAAQYSNLEYDLDAGARGKRDVHAGRLLERVLGAEAALVVNNNAAAVYLVLRTLARGGEAIVSRGELVEIGDGFRIPDIMAESGALLREVGTTNRTRLTDYERAINERTRLLMTVHPSNFRIVGFAGRPSLAELVELGRRVRLPVYEDLGSGCLVNLSPFGLKEPLAQESLAAGADIITFSGDKLLGGPQAGLLAGRREFLDRIRRNPLYRALRVDKLTLAALEATLGAVLRGALDEIPALRMIREPADEIERRARGLAAALAAALPSDGIEIAVEPGESLVGGGSTPAQHLPTWLVTLASLQSSAAEIEERLRRPPSGLPVIARIEGERVILDLRTVFTEQEPTLVQALVAALKSGR